MWQLYIVSKLAGLQMFVPSPSCLSFLQYWSEEMANYARMRACECDYYPSAAPATRLRTPKSRLWARENHGIRAMVEESLSEAVFQIIQSWNASGEEYQFRGNALNGRCGSGHRRRGQDGPICEHYIQVYACMHAH